MSRTDKLNSRSITRLKMSCKNVTERCANLKSCKINASTEIGKKPSDYSTNAMCFWTVCITVSIGCK